MAAEQKYFKLNSGYSVPALGLGTWLSKPGEVYQAVKDAVKAGYRHLDCAVVYGNQEEVGKAVAELIKEGTVKREDLFITGKIWNTFHSHKACSAAIDEDLKQFGLKYLDLMLIHFPFGFAEGEGIFPKNADDTIKHSDVDYLETWKALEEAVAAGKVRSIGVSNFSKEQIQRVLDNCTVKPVTNQVECHPYFNQADLKSFCEQNGLLLTDYSPLTNPGSIFRQDHQDNVLLDPVVKGLAETKSKSPAQIVIRWAVQRGTICIPKSTSKHRIEENFNIWDFQLTPQEMKQMDSLGSRNMRMNAMPGNESHKYYPFHASL